MSDYLLSQPIPARMVDSWQCLVQMTRRLIPAITSTTGEPAHRLPCWSDSFDKHE